MKLINILLFLGSILLIPLAIYIDRDLLSPILLTVGLLSIIFQIFYFKKISKTWKEKIYPYIKEFCVALLG